MTVIDIKPQTRRHSPAPTPPTPAIHLDNVSSTVGETTTLAPVSLHIDSGKVVGIAGGSGAGKTTLLETMAGVRSPSSGRVTRYEVAAFVPQDDIIHRELPLRATLLHAAALRLDVDTDARTAAVDRVLAQLDLADKADVTVADLSGGQQKRASLAAEMLTDPRLFFLDEPTSGLDPARSAELLDALGDLAQSGSAVVVTTHAPADLARCDEVIFLARGGHLVFIGSPDDALSHFGVAALADIYNVLDDWTPTPITDVETTAASPHAAPVPNPSPRQQAVQDETPGALRQWRALAKRNVDLIVGNRLTLAIILGSPVLIISMMTLLFPSGAFDSPAGTTMAIQTLFWMAFNSFFFGLTYGLLQVVGEFEIVRRERRNGLSLAAYVASKLTVLVPLLAVVNVAQLGAMEAAGRLPDMSTPDRLGMFVSLQLLSMAAVGIGLHASAAVRNPAQATLALPMLCFPQVLFAGAVVPISDMSTFGKMMSMPLAVRWSFEPLGRILDMAPAAAQEPGTSGFVESFTGSPAPGWLVLAALAIGASAATVRTLHKRTVVSATG